MKRPCIILGMPHFYGMPDLLCTELQTQGFDVIDLTRISQNFRYPNLAIRLKSYWQKHILGDKLAKRRAQIEYLKHELDKALYPHGGQADYALFISGDVFHPDFLHYVRQKTRAGSINYQWDGLARHPAIADCITAFDRFYVFDARDLTHNPTFLPATNFYLPCRQPAPTASNLAKPRLLFTGTHQDQRAAIVQQFADHATHSGWHLDFKIVWKINRNLRQARQTYPNTAIELSHHGENYADYLTRAAQADVLVDFLEAVHQGLSFRTFEALGMHKKLITTNAHVRHYDFYHPDNIYILTEDNIAGVDTFLCQPYHMLPASIYEKYRFDNWLRYLLRIEPHRAITLPAPDNH